MISPFRGQSDFIILQALYFRKTSSPHENKTLSKKLNLQYMFNMLQGGLDDIDEEALLAEEEEEGDDTRSWRR